MTMKTTFADFNAITEAGHVSLSTVGSQADIKRAGLRPGDWTWLSDGELVAGAQLAVDARYGLVGTVDWDTLVHLDDQSPDDIDGIKLALGGLLAAERHSNADEIEIFKLLTILDHLMPSAADTGRERFDFRRAVALRQLGKLPLALLEAAEARQNRPGDPMLDFLYLDILRRSDLTSAVAEAERIERSPNAPALVLAGCINVLADHADKLAQDEFLQIADRILSFSERFERAQDRHEIPLPTQAVAYFNRAMVLLRMGQVDAARQALAQAQATDPALAEIGDPARLTGYDQKLRGTAARVRAKFLVAA